MSTPNDNGNTPDPWAWPCGRRWLAVAAGLVLVLDLLAKILGQYLEAANVIPH